MIRAGGTGLCLAFGASLIAGAAAAARFTVLDLVDPAEISEDTVLFVDGHQVARFHLDQAHPRGEAAVSVSDGPRHDYALCGRITLRRPDGSAEQRVVDGGGTLTDPDGQVFQALAGNDFRLYYLAPADDPRPDIPADAHRSNACDLPVAALAAAAPG